MAPSVEQVHDFVLQIEKTLAARRLYNPTSGPYREANEKVVEKCRAAAREEAFTLRFGPTDLFLEKTSVINRPKREESFFFALYRDGLRELTFSPETIAADLESLLAVFEMKDQLLGPADDMVNYLWRRDLSTISHNAIDCSTSSSLASCRSSARIARRRSRCGFIAKPIASRRRIRKCRRSSISS